MKINLSQSFFLLFIVYFLAFNLPNGRAELTKRDRDNLEEYPYEKNQEVPLDKQLTVSIFDVTYKVLKRLGDGQEGDVFLVTRISDGSKFAMKVYSFNPLWIDQFREQDGDFFALKYCNKSAPFCNLPIAIDADSGVTIFPLLDHTFRDELARCQSEEDKLNLSQKIKDFIKIFENALKEDNISLEDVHYDNYMVQGQKFYRIDFGGMEFKSTPQFKIEKEFFLESFLIKGHKVYRLDSDRAVWTEPLRKTLKTERSPLLDLFNFLIWGKNWNLSDEKEEMTLIELIDKCLDLNPEYLKEEIIDSLKDNHPPKRGCYPPLDSDFENFIQKRQSFLGYNKPKFANFRNHFFSTSSYFDPTKKVSIFDGDKGVLQPYLPSMDDEKKIGICLCIDNP